MTTIANLTSPYIGNLWTANNVNTISSGLGNVLVVSGNAAPSVINYNFGNIDISGNIIKRNITCPENTNPLIGIASSNTVNVSQTQQQQHINKLNLGCVGLYVPGVVLTTTCNNKPFVNININKTPLIGGTKSY